MAHGLLSSRLDDPNTGGGPVKIGKKTLIGLGFGIYLLGLGMLTGVAIDRMLWAKERSEVLGRYEEALREWHRFRMTLEHAQAQR